MGRKPMTAEQRARMRTRILDAARDRFLENGLDGLSMRGIASNVGVSSMTLYLYYDSRDDIVRHIVAEGFGLLNSALDQEVRIGHASDRLERLGRAYLEFAVENSRYYAAMFQYLGDNRVNGSDELISPAAGNAIGVFAATITEVSGEPEGAQTRAATIWASLHGLAMLSIAGQLEHHGVTTEQVQSLIAGAGPWL